MPFLLNFFVTFMFANLKKENVSAIFVALFIYNKRW